MPNAASPTSPDFQVAVNLSVYGILVASDQHGSPSLRRCPPRSRARYVVAALAGFVLILCLLEVLVRFFVMGPGTLFSSDADIGKVPVTGTRVLWGTEGYGRTDYVRDGEIATPFETGGVVVVLGDSHTEALQVDDAAKFVSVAETELRRRGRLFDPRNLGFSGGTMADYVQLGPSIMSRYHPAVLVIQLSSADFGPETFDSSHVNHFAREPDGSLRLVHLDMRVGPPSLGARLMHASALVNYSQLRYLRIAERRGTRSPGMQEEMPLHRRPFNGILSPLSSRCSMARIPMSR